MMMGNHRMLCTFTMQQIGRWVVTHSKADSSRLHLAMATNHQVYEDPCDACINAWGFPPFLPC